MDKNTILNFLRKDRKKLKADLLAVFAMGVMLIILGNVFFGKGAISSAKNVIVPDTQKETVQADSNQQLEDRLAAVFANIDGAGKVDVMVTLKAGNEIVIAEEEKTRNLQGEVSSEKSAVILSKGGGSETPLVLKEKYPEIEGVIIVAEGGEDIFVRESLTKGAQALLDVPAHKVEVFKMKN